MTSSTAVTTLQNTQLPAHLQSAAALLALNDTALGGIKAGGFPSIGIKGSKFFIKDPAADPPVQLITMDIGGQALPTPYLDTVIIAANPGLSKKFYSGPYDESAEDKTPDCSSDNGLVPDAHIAKPVHSNCSTCPKNQWGSKINEATGKESKACADTKRLVVVPSADLNFKALALDVTAAALKDYGAYIRTLSARNAPVVGVVTRITFDPEASFPKLQFDFLRYLTEAEFAVVQERMDSDEVRNIVAPKRIPIQPAAATVSMPDPTQHNATVAIESAARSAAAGPTVTEVDKVAAAAAAVVVDPATVPSPSGTVSFGGGAPAAEAPKRGRPKKETPAAPVDAVTAAAAAAVVGGPDINTVPEPFKSAIVAAGGLGTPGGDAIYAAIPKAAPAPAAVSPTPPVTPGPAATTFATAPASATVAAKGDDLTSKLAALLKK